MNQFAIVPSQKIDPIKWDICVAENTNGMIYAQYNYLNNLCTHWSALIIGNYQAILPLPWKKKWGIRYFYAPPFIQQLGLIGKQHLITIAQLKKQLTKIAWYGDLFWNNQNAAFVSSLDCKAKINFVLDLHQTYHSINSHYSNDLHQNIQKASKIGLQYQIVDTLNEIISCYHKQYGDRFTRVVKQDFQHFEAVCQQLFLNNNCFIREAQDPTTLKALASAILLKDNKRIYLVVNTITQAGRKCSANHFLIDSILKEFCEQELLFDFEGSELEGVQDFYKNFHPMNQPYFHYLHNEFPLGIKWLFQLIH
jgi:hypothetical protein